MYISSLYQVSSCFNACNDSIVVLPMFVYIFIHSNIKQTHTHTHTHTFTL